MKNPTLLESYEIFDKAQKFLKPYKGFMTESQCKELVHQAGLPTFPRPKGVPENFRVKLSEKGAGIKYVHPSNQQTYARVMPGKIHSGHRHQQNPYIFQMREGKVLDKFGNKILNGDAPEAHIPYNEFMYRG